MKYFVLLLVLIAVLSASCKKDKSGPVTPRGVDTSNILSPETFLKNIPINKDTLYIDSWNEMDFRVQVNGFRIHRVNITIDNRSPLTFSTTVINSLFLGLSLSPGLYKIQFEMYALHTNVGVTYDTIHLRSRLLNLRIEDNLGKKYVFFSRENGTLRITWPQLDRDFTKNYLIERLTGVNQIRQEIATTDSTFVDRYYVGEEVTYKISVINKENIQEKTWCIHMNKAAPVIKVHQDLLSGYRIYWTRCPYSENLKCYNLFKLVNGNEELVYTSSDANDTTFVLANAKFGEEGRFYLEYIPKVFPDGVTIANRDIYRFFLYKMFGEQSIAYDYIAPVDESFLVYISNGKIYKYSMLQDRTVDSIVHPNVRYGFLYTTTAGRYLYAIDENYYGSPVYIWPTAAFQVNPTYTFQIDYQVPPISDALTAIMAQPSATSNSTYAVYNVTNGSIVAPSSIIASSFRPAISSDGRYVFLNSLELGLYEVSGFSLNEIWKDGTKIYKYYGFDPVNPDVCYTFDEYKTFNIVNIQGFSVKTSYHLNVEQILNIDFRSRLILAYDVNYLFVFNLGDGSLVKQIPADASQLLYYSNETILVGHSIYNNHGIRYDLSKKK